MERSHAPTVLCITTEQDVQEHNPSYLQSPDAKQFISPLGEGRLPLSSTSVNYLHFTAEGTWSREAS